MRVTWQIGVTSVNAFGGAGGDDYGVFHRARDFRLEGRYRPEADSQYEQLWAKPIIC